MPLSIFLPLLGEHKIKYTIKCVDELVPPVRLDHSKSRAQVKWGRELLARRSS